MDCPCCGGREACLGGRAAWSGGSLIKELRLLKTRFAKPSTSTLTAADGSILNTDSSKLESTLTAADGSILNTDSSKLERWAKHFTSVVNCGMDVSQVSLDSLPVIPFPSSLLNFMTLTICVLHSLKRRSLMPFLS